MRHRSSCRRRTKAILLIMIIMVMNLTKNRAYNEETPFITAGTGGRNIAPSKLKMRGTCAPVHLMVDAHALATVRYIFDVGRGRYTTSA